MLLCLYLNVMSAALQFLFGNKRCIKKQAEYNIKEQYACLRFEYSLEHRIESNYKQKQQHPDIPLSVANSKNNR